MTTTRKMWRVTLILYLPVSFVLANNNFVKVGDFVCPREERALGQCLKDALNTYIPFLARGLPQYGVPSCEPLFMPELQLAQSAGPITVKSSYSDVTVRGPSTMRITEIQVDSKSHRIIGKVFIPELRVKGKYDLSGQLLMLPISGDGIFTGKYSNINATVTIILGRAPRSSGNDALTCEDMQIQFQIGKAVMHLDNLFDGDDKLGSTVNNLLNENWQKLSEELQTPLQKTMVDFLKPLADRAFSTLNADDILGI